MVHERIVTASSRRQIIIVGPEKLVGALGERGRVPVEVIPLARGLVAGRLKALGLRPELRLAAGVSAGAASGAAVDATVVPAATAPFVSENGNLTFDCALPAPLVDGRAARELEAAILAIPGVVDTGLFLGTAQQVLVGHPDGRVDILTRVGA